MKGYTHQVKNEDDYAFGRVEGVDASFKDLCEVCGRIRGLEAERALKLLEQFSAGDLPVLYKSRNKRLGHRKQLGGQRGRYPKKAATIVLKLLNSVVANAKGKGLIEPYIVEHASANKKYSYPRLASKGRRARQAYELARVEMILREKEEAKRERKEKPKEEKKPEVKEKPEVKKEEPKKEVKEKETQKEVEKKKVAKVEEKVEEKKLEKKAVSEKEQGKMKEIQRKKEKIADVKKKGEL